MKAETSGRLCVDRSHPGIALCLMFSVLLLAAGCGSERSTEAYCKTFYGEGQKFRSQYQNMDPQKDSVGSALALLGAPQEAALFFGKLDKVAPDDIEPDIKVLQDAMQKTSDNLGKNATDLLGAMAEAFALSASTRGSEQRVNSYTLQKCGPPPH